MRFLSDFTMEKHGAGIVAKSKFKFLMLLPKPTSTSATAVNLHNQNQNPNQYLFSPARVPFENKVVKSRQCPITTVVFQEARNKPNGPGSSSRFAKEPTSPKISCMGQIKSRKKSYKNEKDGFSKTPLIPQDFILEPRKKKTEEKNRGRKQGKTEEKNRGRNPFSRGKQGKKSENIQSDSEKDVKIPDRAPSLSQMKRFASARDTFSKFDYNKAQIAPENRDPGYYSSGEDEDDDEEEREEPMIPFSAPILRGGCDGGISSTDLQPRKEINLWKRRTMVQPKPLQLR